MDIGNVEELERPTLTERLRRTFLNIKDNRPKNRWLCIIYAVICLVLLLLVFYQSQLYIKLRSIDITREALTEDIKKSIDLRKKAADAPLPMSTPAPPGITPHNMFDQGQRDLIKKAVDELLRDPEVRNSFPSFDGLPIEQTKAVVVPLWQFENSYDWGQMGITEAAYVWAKNDYSNPDGLTIRERPIDSQRIKKLNLDNGKYAHIEKTGIPQMTNEGTPRIFLAQRLLHESALQKLKFTLLHEIVHAHEVSGFKPWLNFVHNDLIYNPDYCVMMDKLNLDLEKRYTEYAQRIFMILFFMLTGCFVYFAILGDPDPGDADPCVSDVTN